MCETSLQPGSESDREPGEMSVNWGVGLAAVRCVLTYLVGPLVGSVGAILQGAGLALQVIGVCSATYGALTLRRRRHRLWGLYAVIAGALWLVTLLSVAGFTSV